MCYVPFGRGVGNEEGGEFLLFNFMSTPPEFSLSYAYIAFILKIKLKNAL